MNMERSSRMHEKRKSQLTNCHVVFWDFDILFELLVRGFIWSPCFVVLGQDASSPRVGCLFERLLLIILPTQEQVWLLQNAWIQGLLCQTELLCFQSLEQPRPLWLNLWLFRLTACKKAMHAISWWYRTVYILWLVATYDTNKSKR